MGKYDDAIYEFLSDNGRFADLFNGAVFHGQRVVEAEKLTEAAERYVMGMAEVEPQEMEISKASGGGHRRRKTRNRYRDIKKHMANGTGLAVVAVENLSAVDYTIPLRIMQYDYLEYNRQIKAVESQKRRELQKKGKKAHTYNTRFGRQDRLYPTYTICLYHGTEPWDGAGSLEEMMDFDVDDKLRDTLFHDYHITLVCVDDLKDFSMFQTDLRLLLESLAVRKDKTAMRSLFEREEYADIPVETARTIAIMTDNEQILRKLGKGEEERVNMCQAMRELEHDWMEAGRNAGLREGKSAGLREGRRAGIKEGIKEGIKALILDNLEEGKAEEAIIEKLVRRFSLKAEEAKEYYRETVSL